MKKWQKDRIAYGWARLFLPAHIEELIDKFKISDDPIEQMYFNIEIRQAEEELQIIEEEYKRITNG